jgi:hypothetical protein
LLSGFIVRSDHLNSSHRAGGRGGGWVLSSDLPDERGGGARNRRSARYYRWLRLDFIGLPIIVTGEDNKKPIFAYSGDTVIVLHVNLSNAVTL